MLDAETTASTNQKFTSYDRSDKTGLDYAVNRIYSSEQARFLQPDPIGMASADLTDPQSLNMYTYARDNPIDFVDPSGTHPRYIRYFLDGIEISEEMGLQMLESEAVEPSGSYSGPLGFWVDFNDWSKTDEYGFPGTGTRFIVNRSYVSKLLRESRSKPIFPVHQKEEEVGGGLEEQDGYSKSKPKGDWRVRALVRGGAPKAKAAMPVLNVIGTVMSLFTLPVAAAGSGVAVRIGQGTVRGSVKLLPQFTKSTIDEAVYITIKQKGKHIFAGKRHPKPHLNELAVQMGGRENVIRTALQNANGRFPASGIFELYVNVGGKNLTIRGFINKGKPIINTMY